MAYAGVCALGGEDSRPIMGAINLCPGAFESLPPKRQLETDMHELLYAFVSGVVGLHSKASLESVGLLRGPASRRTVVLDAGMQLYLNVQTSPTMLLLLLLLLLAGFFSLVPAVQGW
jgi:hypothetical protein